MNYININFTTYTKDNKLFIVSKYSNTVYIIAKKKIYFSCKQCLFLNDMYILPNQNTSKDPIKIILKHLKYIKKNNIKMLCPICKKNLI